MFSQGWVSSSVLLWLWKPQYVSWKAVKVQITPDSRRSVKSRWWRPWSVFCRWAATFIPWYDTEIDLQDLSTFHFHMQIRQSSKHYNITHWTLRPADSCNSRSQATFNIAAGIIYTSHVCCSSLRRGSKWWRQWTNYVLTSVVNLENNMLLVSTDKAVGLIPPCSLVVSVSMLVCL